MCCVKASRAVWTSASFIQIQQILLSKKIKATATAPIERTALESLLANVNSNIDDDCCGIDAVLAWQPRSLVFIVVKQMMKIGKTMNTKWVRLCIDAYSNTTLTSVVAQGFFGRCCGYNKAGHGTTVVCWKQHADEYIRVSKEMVNCLI